MKTKVIRRTVMTLVMAGVVAGVGLVPGPASASGGGGCGRAVSDRHGTAISIKAFCFGPTVLRVKTGRAVTWVNKDPFSHTVLGANAVWGGFDQLKTGEKVTYRFKRPGVYPYVCTFHAGMVGVVVVGSANGPGAAGMTATKAGPVTRVVRAAGAPRTTAGIHSVPPPAPEPAPAPAPAGAPTLAITPASGWPMGAWWVVGALLVAITTAVTMRTRSRGRATAA
jgi:plastocyanin